MEKAEPMSLALLGKTVPDFSATDLDGKSDFASAISRESRLTRFLGSLVRTLPPRNAECQTGFTIPIRIRDLILSVLVLTLMKQDCAITSRENEIPWRQICSGQGWQSSLSPNSMASIQTIPAPWLIAIEMAN